MQVYITFENTTINYTDSQNLQQMQYVDTAKNFVNQNGKNHWTALEKKIPHVSKGIIRKNEYKKGLRESQSIHFLPSGGRDVQLVVT